VFFLCYIPGLSWFHSKNSISRQNMTSFHALAIDSAFFANSTNLPYKTLEINKSEVEKVKKKIF